MEQTRFISPPGEIVDRALEKYCGRLVNILNRYRKKYPSKMHIYLYLYVLYVQGMAGSITDCWLCVAGRCRATL